MTNHVMWYSSSWKILAKGIPKNNYEQRRNDKSALNTGLASTGVVENPRKRGVSLFDEEGCSDEDDDEDD